jgi:tripartite-type tricarboxylate transporter receptor subunit TctC
MMAQVPTFAEQGLPDVDVVFWFGIVAPAGTPADVIEKLNGAAAKSLEDPMVKERFAKEGIDGAAGPAADFAGVIAKGAVQWQGLVTRLDLKQK